MSHASLARSCFRPSALVVRAFYIQHYYALVSEADIALYAGEPATAFRIVRGEARRRSNAPASCESTTCASNGCICARGALSPWRSVPRPLPRSRSWPQQRRMPNASSRRESRGVTGSLLFYARASRRFETIARRLSSGSNFRSALSTARTWRCTPPLLARARRRYSEVRRGPLSRPRCEPGWKRSES